MKAIGHRSIASILRVVLRIFSILLWVGAFFGAIAGLCLILVSVGIGLPFVEIDSLSPALALLANCILIVTFTASLIIVGRLRKIFSTLADGDPFVEENARNLQVVWVTLAIWELARYVLGGAAAALKYFFRPEGLPGHDLTVQISLSVWFAVLALIVLSEVFREGARLREEQKLTI